MKTKLTIKNNNLKNIQKKQILDTINDLISDFTGKQETSMIRIREYLTQSNNKKVKMTFVVATKIINDIIKDLDYYSIEREKVIEIKKYIENMDNFFTITNKTPLFSKVINNKETGLFDLYLFKLPNLIKLTNKEVSKFGIQEKGELFINIEKNQIETEDGNKILFLKEKTKKSIINDLVNIDKTKPKKILKGNSKNKENFNDISSYINNFKEKGKLKKFSYRDGLIKLDIEKIKDSYIYHIST